jgi:hypothetical protein
LYFLRCENFDKMTVSLQPIIKRENAQFSLSVILVMLKNFLNLKILSKRPGACTIKNLRL